MATAVESTSLPELPSNVNVYTIRNLYEENDLWEVLAVSEPWIENDLGMDKSDAHHLLLNLKQANAIEVVGERNRTNIGDDNSTSFVAEYKFDRQVREFLEAYQERATRFCDVVDGDACNHRVHVNNSPGDGLGCKYCDETRNYPRDAVRRGL